jgi:hypothetical protein
LILGLESSAIGTLVERTSRFTILLHLPRMDGHGNEPSVKNGPALAGHGAERPLPRRYWDSRPARSIRVAGPQRGRRPDRTAGQRLFAPKQRTPSCEG